MFAVHTEASTQALENLRSAGNFQWYLVPLLAFIVYVYVVEAERGEWNVFLTGLAFFGGEFAWEMFNALVLHWSGRSAMWTTPGDTAYLVLVGLTIEISAMFAVAGVILAKALPEERSARVLGVPNRLFVPFAFAVGCVLVEAILNAWGVLVWEYAWWRWPNLWLVVAAYTIGFYLATVFYDLRSMKVKVAIVCGLFAFNAAAFTVLGPVLGWI